MEITNVFRRGFVFNSFLLLEGILDLVYKKSVSINNKQLITCRTGFNYLCC